MQSVVHTQTQRLVQLSDFEPPVGYFGWWLLTSFGVSVEFLGLFETFVLLGLNVAGESANYGDLDFNLSDIFFYSCCASVPSIQQLLWNLS